MENRENPTTGRGIHNEAFITLLKHDDTFETWLRRTKDASRATSLLLSLFHTPRAPWHRYSAFIAGDRWTRRRNDQRDNSRTLASLVQPTSSRAIFPSLADDQTSTTRCLVTRLSFADSRKSLGPPPPLGATRTFILRAHERTNTLAKLASTSIDWPDSESGALVQRHRHKLLSFEPLHRKFLVFFTRWRIGKFSGARERSDDEGGTERRMQGGVLSKYLPFPRSRRRRAGALRATRACVMNAVLPSTRG